MFKIGALDASKPNQLEVDLQVYSHDSVLFQLTFDRKEIEAKGIEWNQFVKSTAEVLDELVVKAMAREQATSTHP